MRLTITLMLLFTVGCGATVSFPNPEKDGGDDNNTTDMGTSDATTDRVLLFETYDRPDYNPLPVSSGDNFELTTGFQGGWMFDLVLVMHDVEEPTMMFGEYDYTVTRGADVLLDTTQPFQGWERRIDGAAFDLFRQPLDIFQADEVVGDEVVIDVTFRFDDGSVVSGSLTVTVVDEFEEADFG